MKRTREQVLADVLEVFRSLDEDADPDEELTEDTYLIGDMNWQSIELVVFANAMQDRYGQQFPFTEFLAEAGESNAQDLTIGEWVDFIYENLND